MRVKKEINIQVGERIKAAREQARLTQEQFAERIDVSMQYVSDLERGVVGASIPTLRNICKCLCVSSDQLLFGRVSDETLVDIVDRCKMLDREQIVLLGEIVDRFIRAVQIERNKPT